MKYKKIKIGRKIGEKFSADGFMLIEVLIYIALSSLLLTGTIISTYALIDGGAWLTLRTDALTEGHFVLQKIDKTSALDFEVYLEEGRIWLARDGGEPRALTTSRVTAENFEFKNGRLNFSINGMKFNKKIWLK